VQAGVMTMYTMFRSVEDKGIVNYKIANLEVSRAATASSGVPDTIIVKKINGTASKLFKFADPTPADAQKMFWRAVKPSALPTPSVAAVFRFRYEKVGRNFKPQKLYAVTKVALQLKANVPRRVV
jgi:hypothetical protein